MCPWLEISPTSGGETDGNQLSPLPAHQLPLSSTGADVILGGETRDFASFWVRSIAPSATALFAPRGAVLVDPTGPLWVSDTGHHRLLGWHHRPCEDQQPADWVIGQPDFYHKEQNATGKPGRATLNVPTGICRCGEGLAVADAWNHRVLIWKHLPEDSNVPADVVLGQIDFTQNELNRGSLEAANNTMHWPYGVLYHQGRLMVADTGNRRVLIWNQLPAENGQPADLVLGQPTMQSRHENSGGSPSASSMRWPHGLAVWGNHLVVSDAGNHRIMIWDGIPTQTNAPCSLVLGQQTLDSVAAHQSTCLPSATSLHMPYGVAATEDWLVVADTANSRLMGWQNLRSLLSLQGTSADALAGQWHFHGKGENRFYSVPTRDSLSWPYGIQICDNTVVIADSGNNRVLLWQLENL